MPWEGWPVVRGPRLLKHGVPRDRELEAVAGLEEESLLVQNVLRDGLDGAQTTLRTSLTNTITFH